MSLYTTIQPYVGSYSPYDIKLFIVGAAGFVATLLYAYRCWKIPFKQKDIDNAYTNGHDTCSALLANDIEQLHIRYEKQLEQKHSELVIAKEMAMTNTKWYDEATAENERLQMLIDTNGNVGAGKYQKERIIAHLAQTLDGYEQIEIQADKLVAVLVEK